MRFSDFQGKPNNNAAAAQVGPLTIDNTVKRLTTIAPLDTATEFVVVRVETASLRLTIDNQTNPTTTLGFQYPVGSEILLSRAEAENARMIRDTATSAAIQVAQFTA